MEAIASKRKALLQTLVEEVSIRESKPGKFGPLTPQRRKNVGDNITLMRLLGILIMIYSCIIHI